MLMNLLLSLIPILLSGLLSSYTSGGAVRGILDLPDFLLVTVIFVICVFISGYGKAFCRIFSSKEKYEALSLEQLQETEKSLDFSGKMLFYTAMFFPVLSFISLLANTPWDSEDIHSIGPNSAVQFLCGVYLCVFEMIIVMLKAKTRKSIILYMAEIDESVGEINIDCRKIKRIVTGIILLLVVAAFYVKINMPYYIIPSTISSVLDLPTFLIIVIFVIPLVAISGNLKNLWDAVKTLFSNKKINIARKNLYLNAVKMTCTLNWYGAITATIIGWIGMMNNLEDASSLFPNIAVSIIGLFYAVLFNLFFVVVETRINKVTE